MLESWNNTEIKKHVAAGNTGPIKPHLHYCTRIWQSTFESHLQKLNSIHKKSLKLIGKNEEYLSMELLHHQSYSTFVFKFLAGELLSAFKKLF